MTNVTRKNKMLPKSAALLSMLKDAMPDSAISNRYKTGRLRFRKIDGMEILKTLPGVIDEFWDNLEPGKPGSPTITRCAHYYFQDYCDDDAIKIITDPNIEKMVVCAARVGGMSNGIPDEYFLQVWELVNNRVARRIYFEIHEGL